jgi:hypothetical protein
MAIVALLLAFEVEATRHFREMLNPREVTTVAD